MSKQDATDFASFLPPKRDERDIPIVELIAETAKRDCEHAAQLLEWIGQGLGVKELNDLLISAAQWVGGYSGAAEDPRRLAWCEALMRRGADPFAFHPEEGGRRYEPSLAERLAKAGYWVYLSELTERQGPGGMALVKEALSRMEARPYSGGEIRRVALESGPRGVEFFCRAGFDPNALVKGEPWVFHCQDGATLEAMARAGADVSVKDQCGLSLEERVSQRPSGRARQGMLDALRSLQASQPLAEEQALKAMASVAVDGNYKELTQLASGAGLNAAQAKAASGRSMLAIALLNANWPLAADLMTLGKADPAQACPVDGVPTGALALWARNPSHKKPSKAKLNKQAECLKLALAEPVASWRSEAGEDLLEACAKLVPEGRKGYERAGAWLEEAAKAAIQAAPLNAASPLWARLSGWGMGMELISFAAAAREEPWIAQGKGLLAASLSARSNTWLRHATPLSELESAVANSRSRSRSEAQLFSLPQWALAFEAFWEIAAKEKDSPEGVQQWGPARRAVMDMERGLRKSAKLGKLGVMPPLDFEALSGLIQEAFDPARGLASSAGVWVKELVGAWRFDEPERFASLTLDLLARDEPEAVEAADAAWKEAQRLSAGIVWPKDHPVFDKPATPARAQSPLWAMLQELRSAIEEKPVARAARRL